MRARRAKGQPYVTLQNVPEGAERQANFALRRINDIWTAAAGRELTTAQRADFDEARGVFTRALDSLPGGQDEYVRGMASRIFNSTNPQAHESARQETERLERMLALRSYADTHPGYRAVVRDAGDDTPRRHDVGGIFGDAWTSRALSGIAVDGSNFVPTEFSDEFWSTLRARGTLLGTNLTVFETDAYQFSLPIGTAATVVSITGQGTAISESTPSGTAALIVPQRFGALSQVTNEFWADISAQQRAYIVNDHILSIRNSMESQMITGSGAPGFTGLTGTNAYGTVTGGTVANVGLAPYAEAIGSAYAGNIVPSHWLVSAVDYGKLAQVTAGGTVGGDLRPLITPNANAAGGALSQSILGIPALVSSNVPSGTAFLVDDTQLIFVRRTDIEQLVDPYSLSSTYSTRLRTVARAGFHAIPKRFVRVNSLA